MKTITKAQLAKARRLVKRADEAAIKESTKRSYLKAKQLVGRYFRYDNGREWGYHYHQVIGAEPGWQNNAQVTMRSFMQSTNPLNGIQIEQHKRYDARDGVLDPAYEEITKELFDTEVRKILTPLGLMTVEDAERLFSEPV